MPRIAEHHKNDPYRPLGDWPDNVLVQWGRGGLVINPDDSGYAVAAFFEAFPKDNASSFIRGEGPTLLDAEREALIAYKRELACEHRWCRGRYTNGGGVCAKCNAFQTVFKPIVKLGDWRKPIEPEQEWMLNKDRYPGAPTPDNSPYLHKLALRRKVYGVGPRVKKTGLEGLLQRIRLGKDETV